MPFSLTFTLALLAIRTAHGALLDACQTSTFTNLSVFGAKVVDVHTNLVQNYTSWATPHVTLNFCNVTLTYTHPGRDDTINVYAALPLSNWNGRFQGVGGGGWVTGKNASSIAGATALGFAVASTDGGHTNNDGSSGSWALNSPGNVDLNLLQDFASVALSDLGLFGKQVTEKFFGQPPSYSYWNGCSTGGRQGLMLAQRYPDIFDGILAVAPAIYWDWFIVAAAWMQHVMNKIQHWPAPCELEAITQAAVDACDGLDGLRDGILSLPGVCQFDARTLVGRDFFCEGEERVFMNETAVVANAAWNGPMNPAVLDEWYWYGLLRGAPFAVNGEGVGATICDGANSTSCRGLQFSIGEEWLRLFILKDPNFVTFNMTDELYFSLFQKAHEEYGSIIGTSDPDLSNFKAQGGKMITWHGMSDQLIPLNGSSHYYEKVKGLDADVQDFYRYYEAPGVLHCSGGLGPLPENTETLAALMAWVENGTAPETLTARSQVGDGTVRNLCLWPKTLVYVGGEAKLPESWACE